MPAASRKDGVDCGDGVGGTSHRDRVEWLHESGRRGEEGGVDSTAGCRDDLATPAGDSVGGEGDVGQAELGITDC